MQRKWIRTVVPSLEDALEGDCRFAFERVAFAHSCNRRNTIDEPPGTARVRGKLPVPSYFQKVFEDRSTVLRHKPDRLEHLPQIRPAFRTRRGNATAGLRNRIGEETDSCPPGLLYGPLPARK